MAQRKPRGSGSVRIKHGNWRGRFYIGGNRREVILGRARTRSVPDGMTEAQAYKALGDHIREAVPAPDEPSMNDSQLAQLALEIFTTPPRPAADTAAGVTASPPSRS